MTAAEFRPCVSLQLHSTSRDTVGFGLLTLAKMESRSRPQNLASLFKRRFWESQPSCIYNRVLKSPPFSGNVTVSIHKWWIGTIFAGTLFFRFTFFRVAKESEQQTNEERISK